MRTRILLVYGPFPPRPIHQHMAGRPPVHLPNKSLRELFERSLLFAVAARCAYVDPKTPVISRYVLLELVPTSPVEAQQPEEIRRRHLAEIGGVFLVVDRQV